MGGLRAAAVELRDLLLAAVVIGAALCAAWKIADYIRGNPRFLPGHGHAAGDDLELEACEICRARGGH